MFKIKRYASKIYFKIKPKKKLRLDKYVFVESFNGRVVGGNPYYLGKYIAHRENLPLIISTNDKELKGKKIEDEYYINRLDYNFENIVNNATYVIINNDIYISDFKPKGYVVQTWHGTPLKKIGRHIGDWSHISVYINKFESQLKEVDLLLAQNEYSKKIFYEAFNNVIEPEVTGYPKNDYLVNKLKEKEKFKYELGYNEYKKIILYAPTWRDDSFYKKERCYKSLVDYDKLHKVLDEDTLFIIKPHENEKNCILKESEYKNIKIVTDINLNILIIISDKLITDYSSVYFDYMLTGNRIDFYAPDYNKYKEELRDMYFEYKEENLPGVIYFKEDSLYENINKYQKEDEYKYAQLKAQYLPLDDGEVCKRVYEKCIIKTEG